MQVPNRIIINELPDKVEIIIPAKTNWITLVIFMLIIGFWIATGGLSALIALPDKKEIDYSDWVWGLWGIAVILVMLRAFLFVVNAKEIIAINQQTISINRRGAAFSSTQRYDLSKARYFRLEESVDNDSLLDGLNNDEIGAGVICFSYNRQTIRFGEFISNQEAELILTQLQRKQLLTSKNL